MNIPFLILYFSFLAYAYMAVHTFRNTGSPLGRVFIVICGSLAFWSINTALLFIAPDKEAAFFWFKLSSPGWAFMAGMLLHFSLTLTGRVAGGRWKVYALCYIPGLLFTLGEQFIGFQAADFAWKSYGWHSIPRDDSPLFWAFILYYVVYVLVSVIMVYRWGKKAPKKRYQKQARIIAPNLLLSFVLVTVNESLLPLAGYNLPKVPAAIGLIWVTAIWYAMTRHRLMEFTTALATTEIISSIQDMMFLVSPKGIITRVNPRVMEIFSCQEEDLLGLSAVRLFVQEPSHWQELFAGEMPFLEAEAEIKRYKGEDLPVYLRATVIRDRSGDITGLVLVLQDLRETRRIQGEIQERKSVEEALKASNRRLREVSRVKTEFLSTVSHELRTPLTSILGFAQINLKRYEEIIMPALGEVEDKKAWRAVEQLRNNLEIIITEGRRLTGLINDVLDIARMEAGRTQWEEEQLEVGEIIGVALAAYAPRFAQKGVELCTRVEEGLPALWGDRDRLTQVITNILSNAIKFTPAPGRVTLEACRGEGEVVIRVTDTGGGIPPEELETIFEKFKQVGDTLTDKPQGTGLGLAICKQILEHHGGRIWAESTPGNGSTMSFTLPETRPGDAQAGDAQVGDGS